ncbi:MAG: hypothetical protein R3D02_00675 [Hyphomicrobiales bacterium]
MALRLVSIRREGYGQRLEIEAGGQRHEVSLPLVGRRSCRTLVAAGLAIATGVAVDKDRALGGLEGAAGDSTSLARRRPERSASSTMRTSLRR